MSPSRRGKNRVGYYDTLLLELLEMLDGRPGRCEDIGG